MRLGLNCVACGTNRKHKNLRYDPATYFAYCENVWVCTSDHPNSAQNRLKNGEQVQLLTYDEAVQQFAGLAIAEKSDKIRRLMTSPLSIRINRSEMAEFLVKQSEISGQNISDLVRGYIETMMTRYDTFIAPPEPKPAVKIELSDDDLTF